VSIVANVKIAVVDHDRLTRDFIVNVMMYSVNREILAFDSASDLNRYLHDSGPVNIILSEAYLPDEPGFAVLKSIKETSPEIYLIVLSANPADQSAAEDLGADAFLAKPFTLKDLFSIVERFVVNAAHRSPPHE
jgi:DNA-binding NtrC family response regulator